MKNFILSALVAFPAMLMASPDLGLELLGPKEAVKISQKSMDLAAAIPAVMEQYQAELQKPEFDPKVVKALERQLNEAKALKQAVKLTLRFTNKGKEVIKLPYGSDTSTNRLTVEGPSAIDLPFNGVTTLEFRMPEPTVIKPGESKDFAISELAYGARDLSRWLIAKPGTYLVTVKFQTSLNDKPLELTSNKATFEVKTE